MDFDLIQSLVKPDDNYVLLRKALADAQKKAAVYLELPNAIPPLENGCAATLSALLRGVGVDVKMESGAGDLAELLEDKRGWSRIAVGKQVAGDVGVTFDRTAPHGPDHLYLVIDAINDTDMLIADNQQPGLHQRKTIGGGTTWTSFFLRPKQGKVAAILPMPTIPKLPNIHEHQLTTIISVVDQSEFRSFYWADRGKAPISYLRGMAVAFAHIYSRLKTDATVQQMVATVDLAKKEIDALAWYAERFAQAGLDLSGEPAALLRQLFVLLTGLGMRETSGRYCMGRYMEQANASSDTAEAGLFQASFNLVKNQVRYEPIRIRYAGSTLMRELFSEGVTCAEEEATNWGTGADGIAFQQLSKQCPAFAIEIAALGLRNRRGHWGPINNKKVELCPEWDTLLRVVQWIVDHP